MTGVQTCALPISAAAEGIMLGIPSIALSINTFKSDYYDLAKSVAQTMMKKVLHNGLPKGTLLNVNVPKCSASECSGYKITRQGGEYFLDKLEKREDPRGRQYFWMGGKIINNDKSDDQDGNALANNWISVTPIQYKLTDNSFLDTLSDWGFE